MADILAKVSERKKERFDKGKTAAGEGKTKKRLSLWSSNSLFYSFSFFLPPFLDLSHSWVCTCLIYLTRSHRDEESPLCPPLADHRRTPQHNSLVSGAMSALYMYVFIYAIYQTSYILYIMLVYTCS